MTIHYQPQTRYRLTQPEWSKDAVIYQVNTRQFSPEGNFRGVEQRLPDIRALGADIIYLMPVHPIGQQHRKGELGSPYSVKDYYGINPELGEEQDFMSLVDAIHAQGMKVILDWVPNHSAWDNPLVEAHPEWYAKDHAGNFRPSPWWDWSDIIEFDYSVPALRKYMIDALCHWVERYDIDGFRCDVAGYVPNDFWTQARTALERIKPVFMLAEWEDRDLHETAFNMSYAWSWNETLHAIATRKAPLDRLRKYYSWNERAWPAQAYRMTFVSNHDKNAWDGTQREQFGNCLEAAIVLSVLGEGVPLIHNGQEAGENKRLAFFERDPIDWKKHDIGDLYQRLIQLKKRVSALHNGQFGARMRQVPNSQMDEVLSFIRSKDNQSVFVIINFSDRPVTVRFDGELHHGNYTCDKMLRKRRFNADSLVDLSPWQYQVWLDL